MYCTRRSIPAWSPAASSTDWSTLKPLCSHVRMFSTTSGSIFSSAKYRAKGVELPSGRHVMAVEVHQATVNSSDLAFDLRFFQNDTRCGFNANGR